MAILVGILTNRDLRFETDSSSRPIEELMTKEKLITVPEGTTLEEAKAASAQVTGSRSSWWSMRAAASPD